jgi:hypothetical protein
MERRTLSTIGLKRCEECEGLILYDERHDSFFCKECDKWRNKVCEDKTCFYCVGRAEKPSMRDKDDPRLR